MAAPGRSCDPLVWIDCEMTGLDRSTDTIMSVACFVTDANLNLLDEEGFGAVVRHEKVQLERMDEWCTDTHGKSGLTAACLASTTSASQAASGLVEYIRKYVPEPRRGLLAGNSVHCDKEFLNKPPFDVVTDHLHYRILDVSSIKEAVRRWAPDEVLEKVPRKKGLHQAREDILESIEEAKYYRSLLDKSSD